MAQLEPLEDFAELTNDLARLAEMIELHTRRRRVSFDGVVDTADSIARLRIEGTALPGTTGNVGIAAHRDGFFRVLKDLKEGDALLLDTPVAAEQYRVEWIRITTPDDVSVIDPTPSPAVTLVGCYPFYHVGSAPKRFIVRAVPVAGSAPGN